MIKLKIDENKHLELEAVGSTRQLTIETLAAIKAIYDEFAKTDKLIAEKWALAASLFLISPEIKSFKLDGSELGEEHIHTYKETDDD